MIETEIQIDRVKMRQIEAALRGHDGALHWILDQSVRETAKKGRTLIDREVRKRLAIKQRSVLARISQPCRFRGTASLVTAWYLSISRKRLSIASFGAVHQYAKPKKGWGRGTSYMIRRGQRKIMPHAFVRTMRKKAKSPEAKEETYRVVFRRTLRGEHGFGKGRPTRRGIMPGRIVSRTPLIAPKGPSIGEVIKDAPAVLRKIEREGALKLSTELDRHVKVELSRRMPR